MTADDKFVILQTAAEQTSALKTNGLTVIFRFLLGHIRVPDRVILVRDLDDRRVDVERQRILNIVDLYIVRSVFVDDIAAAIDGSDNLVISHLVHHLRKMLEHDRLCRFHFIDGQIAHIRVVGQISPRVREGHLLIDRPARRHRAVERIQQPHAVVFYDHPLKLQFFLQIREIALGELFLLIHCHDLAARGREFDRRKLRFSFLAEQDQRLLSVVELRVL